MRSIALALLLAACGGSSQKPVQNTAPAGGAAAPSQEPGTARVDTKTTDGGVISFVGDREAAMAAATKAMADHCGAGNYVITQEGEEVTDLEAGKPEWRIHYRCSGAAGSPP
jgi:hypothetical protein